ncbi:MAG: hypothetical protein QM811_22630 [Pirellulales bacterium]
MIGVWAVLGSQRLRVETDFTRNFRDANPVVRSYDYVETHLGGAGVWDVMLPVPLDLTPSDLDRVRALETRIRTLTIRDEAGDESPALTKVLGLVDLLDAVSPVELAGQSDNFVTRAAARHRVERHGDADAGIVRRVPSDRNHGRRSATLDANHAARVERMPAEEKSRIIAEVRDAATTAFPATERALGAQVTGFYVLLAGLIQSMTSDQWWTFAVSAGGMFLMLTVGFRSVMLALIGLIPNILAIFVMLGTLGWSGLRVNMGTVMIAAVSMGLSVDSSIHFLISYRRLRRRLRRVRRVGKRRARSRLGACLGHRGVGRRLQRVDLQRVSADGLLRRAQRSDDDRRHVRQLGRVAAAGRRMGTMARREGWGWGLGAGGWGGCDRKAASGTRGPGLNPHRSSSEFPHREPFPANRVRITLDSPRLRRGGVLPMLRSPPRRAGIA